MYVKMGRWPDRQRCGNMGATSTYAAEETHVAYESDRDRIARELRESIRTRKYAPGDRLPSAAQLAARYEVSIRTVQDAISTLKGEGVVYGRQGRGVFVGSEPGADASPTTQAESRRLDELEGQVAQLRDQQALTEASLNELYDRLGQPRPSADATKRQGRRRSG